MGRVSDWLREERRKTLGDWVAFCLRCGHVQRYFQESEAELPARCPACGGELRARCPFCGARIASAFAVVCEECEAGLRPPEAFGVPIRKPEARRSRRSG
jgi:DNA-directed RNA polymerase subunit RPC12/RpoP